MLGLIRKNPILEELNDEIKRNEEYKEKYKGTKDGAMHLGREIALKEVVKRLKSGTKINCDETTYLIDWRKDKKEEALEDILISLNKVAKSDDEKIANTVKCLLEKYIHTEE